MGVALHCERCFAPLPHGGGLDKTCPRCLLSLAMPDNEPLMPNVDPVLKSGATIGRYRILRFVGQGGMGTVYEAEQNHPRRTVALKLIKPGFASTDLLWRFELECEALGRLQHPGIAQIYEAGTSDTGDGPQPYFAMEFIHGRTLMEYADSHQLSTRQRLQIVAKVCDAVHHAHQRGLIHRDLKPGNILVDESGQPKVLDFGVARITDCDTQTTQRTGLGQLVGTLAYMSPEQVLADPLELDTRSDVYSIGVILYELLSARLPLALGKQMFEALEEIRDQEPAPLGSINRNYRGDIETIAAKALEKDKSRRYSSAAELAADIQRYLRDEPIIARPPSAIYQVQKFARRHKGLVGSVAAIFAVLVAGAVTSTWLAVQANRERDRALRAEAAAAIDRDHATAAEAAASFQRDVALRASLDADSAQREATAARSQAVRDRDRSIWQSVARESLRLSSRRADDQLAALLARQAYLLHARTPDQPRYLVEEALQQAGRLNPWSVRLVGHEAVVGSVDFSPDGNQLVTGSADRTARIWDLNDLEAPPLVLAGHANTVNDVAFSPDGTRIVSAAHDQKVRIWDLRAPGAPLLSAISPRPGPVFSAAFSPDGTRVGYADYSGVWIWNLQSPHTPPSFLKGPNLAANSTLPFISMAFSPDGTHIAAGDLFGGVWLWDLNAPQQPRVLRSHPSRVNSVAFSPDGKRLASAGSAREDTFGPQRGRGFEPGTDQTPDWNIRIWDLTNPALPPSMLNGQESQCTGLAFSPDGKQLASAGGDGALRLFDLSRPQLRPISLPAHEGGARSVKYSPDGSRLATSGNDYSVRVWNLQDTGMPLAFPREHQQRVDSIAISPDSHYVASGSADNTAALWNLRDVATPPVRLQHEDGVRSLAFSADSARLASASLVAWRVWSVNDPRAEPVLFKDPHGVQSVRFSVDGRALASTTVTNALVQNDLNKRGANVSLLPAVKRWNLGSAASVPSEIVQDARISTDIAAISTNWNRFASVTPDNSILVWNLRDQGQQPMRLTGHTSYLDGLAFSSRGDLLASSGHDFAIRVWNLLSPQKPRFVFRGSGFFVAFSKDDTRLVAGGVDAADVRMWDLREPTGPPLVFRPGNAELRSVAVSADGDYLVIGDMDGNIWMYRLWSAAADYLCARVSRNLSREEWRIHIGDSIPYERTCPNLPAAAGKPPAFKQ